MSICFDNLQIISVNKLVCSPQVGIMHLIFVKHPLYLELLDKNNDHNNKQI